MKKIQKATKHCNPTEAVLMKITVPSTQSTRVIIGTTVIVSMLSIAIFKKQIK